MAVDWSRPQEIDDVTVAFSADVIGTLMPAEKDLPAAFYTLRAPFVAFVNAWFSGTLTRERRQSLVPKAGIDETTALRHLRTCLGSFEPSHEHKIGAVAYLMSLWFEPEPEQT